MQKEIFLDLLAKYTHSDGWVDCSPLRDIKGNGSKIWYFANKENQKAVIKQYPEWVNEMDVSWIHSYMKELTQKGFPLTEHIGEAIQFNQCFYAIYSFAEGTKYDSSNNLHFVDMARKLRDMHDLSLNIKIDGPRNWPIVSGFKYRGDNNFLMEAWEKASKLFQSSNSIVGPIHGDFRKENIRFNQTGITKIFDFGNARNDYLEADLATTLRNIGDLEEQRKFLLIYRDSSNSKIKIQPTVICASAITLAIQENAYLLKESLKGNNKNLNKILEKESSYLKFLLNSVNLQLSIYKNIFT